MSQLRWGILGTGNIARQFAVGLNSATRSTLSAVGSRSLDVASSFAQIHQIAAFYGSYELLLQDANVDAVYISLPNSLHHEWTIKALRAGKHVLCEKPFAMNVRESEEMFNVAEQTGKKLAEAFMYRSHPLTLEIERVLRAGAIGQIKMIRTSFCYRTTRIADNIRFSAKLGGGALMDIGCYCLSFSRHFAGEEPNFARATGHLHESGVDDYSAGVLGFPSDIAATFACGMILQGNNTAHISGDEGWIEIPLPWKPAPMKSEYAICRGTPPKMDQAGKPSTPVPLREVRFIETTKDLYAHEADDFAACVLDGLPMRVTKQDTLGNMKLLDDLRAQVGVRF